MVNLRNLVEQDLKTSLEGEFSMSVTLIDPDGTTYTTTTDGDPLVGQVLYDKVKINPSTGEELTVNEPIVTLRRSSLIRIPLAGEDWSVKIPGTPKTGADMVTYMLGGRAPEGGASIGFIRLYLQKVEQSA